MSSREADIQVLATAIEALDRIRVYARPDGKAEWSCTLCGGALCWSHEARLSNVVDAAVQHLATCKHK